MFKSGFPLNTLEQFQAVIHNKKPVMIIQRGIMLEYSGVIASQSEESVTLENGDKYLKSTCQFRIR